MQVSFSYARELFEPETIERMAGHYVAVLRALVEFYLEHPDRLPSEPKQHSVRAAVAYVGGMTDRFAFETAVELLGWRRDRLPRPA